MIMRIMGMEVMRETRLRRVSKSKRMNGLVQSRGKLEESMWKVLDLKEMGVIAKRQRGPKI